MIHDDLMMRWIHIWFETAAHKYLIHQLTAIAINIHFNTMIAPCAKDDNGIDGIDGIDDNDDAMK